MEVLRIRFTRPDHATQAGGFILRKHDRGNGDFEYIAHTFNRDRGSKEPREFFWGRYHFNEQDGIRAFNDKVYAATKYTTGGSLIEDYELDRELRKELETDDAGA